MATKIEAYDECPKCQEPCPCWGWESPEKWVCPKCGSACVILLDHAWNPDDDQGSYPVYLVTLADSPSR